MVSICAASDLIRVYGLDIFQNEESTSNDDNTCFTSSSTNTTMKRRLGARKLYTMDQNADLESFNIESVGFGDVIDILLDILDDEVSFIEYL